MMKTDGMFVKLMMMTTSNSDGEALTALRKANKILADAKVSWIELLGAQKPDQSFRVPPSKRPRRPEPQWDDVGDHDRRRPHYVGSDIDEMFDKVFKQKMSEGFASFIESIHIWWEQKGWLSKAQYDALKNAAERDHG